MTTQSDLKNIKYSPHLSKNSPMKRQKRIHSHKIVQPQTVEPWIINESKQYPIESGHSKTYYKDSVELMNRINKHHFGSQTQKSVIKANVVSRDQKANDKDDGNELFLDRSVRLDVYEKAKAKQVSKHTNFIEKNKRAAYDIQKFASLLNEKEDEDVILQKYDLIQENLKLQLESKELNSFISMKPDHLKQKELTPKQIKSYGKQTVQPIVFCCISKEPERASSIKSAKKKSKTKWDLLKRKEIPLERAYRNISSLVVDEEIVLKKKSSNDQSPDNFQTLSRPESHSTPIRQYKASSSPIRNWLMSSVPSRNMSKNNRRLSHENVSKGKTNSEEKSYKNKSNSNHKEYRQLRSSKNQGLEKNMIKRPNIRPKSGNPKLLYQCSRKSYFKRTCESSHGFISAYDDAPLSIKGSQCFLHSNFDEFH